jgi:predicted PurR-regulated permease PerM
VKWSRWISLIGFLTILYLLWQIQQILLLIFTAILLAVPLNRLVYNWRRSGVRRGLALLLSLATLLTFLFFGVSMVAPLFVAQVQWLIQLIPLGFQRLQFWLVQWQIELPSSSQPLFPLQDLTQQTQPLITWMANHFFTFFSDVITVMLHSLLILIFTIMLLANPSAYRRSLIQLFPAFYRERIGAVLSQCEVALVSWMRGVVLEMILVGSMVAVGLWLLKIPFVLTHAFLAGILETIPHLGVCLSLIPPVAVALLDQPWKALAVIGLYLLIQALKYRLMNRLHRPKLNLLLPALMMLAQISFAFFYGFWGLILAVPMVLIGQVCAREIWVKDVLLRRQQKRQWEAGR